VARLRSACAAGAVAAGWQFGPARTGVSARRRARPRRASPAPTSALASLTRPRRARLAGHPPVRAPRRAGTPEDERLRTRMQASR